MKIGIYGGTFNPFHSGHAMVASYAVQMCGLDELWILPAACNPLKVSTQSEDVGEVYRLKMACLGVSDIPKVCVKDIEYKLPKPGYTVKTLAILSEQYPEHDFYLIIGGDNWESFPKWKEPKEIIEKYHIIIFPRPGYEIEIEKQLAAINASTHPNIERIRVVENAPQMLMSSSFIRRMAKDGKSVAGFVPEKVKTYIEKHSLYRDGK